MDEVDLSWLALSYSRRIQFEGRVHAAALINALGASMGAGGETARIPPDAMLAQMGMR